MSYFSVAIAPMKLNEININLELESESRNCIYVAIILSIIVKDLIKIMKYIINIINIYYNII